MGDESARTPLRRRMGFSYGRAAQTERQVPIAPILPAVCKGLSPWPRLCQSGAMKNAITIPCALLLGLGLLVPSAPLLAASNGRLPAWVCGSGTPPLFANGFENGATTHYQEPSNGSGGGFPGAQTRSVLVSGQPRNYYLYVPNGYPFAGPIPLLLALHGAGGAGTAPGAAESVRDVWINTAQSGKFIVASPIASGSQGGWVPYTDYPMFKAVIEDVAAAYNIDRSRIHAWGYSAGGHVLHDLALFDWTPNPVPDINTFAAYGVSAGVLASQVCGGSGLPSCASVLPQVPRRIPVSLRVGDSDDYLSWVQADRNAFLAAGWVSGNTLDYAVFSGGHIIDTYSLHVVWQFFCPWQRLP